MSSEAEALFSAGLWRPALEKYGGVTHLTVALYGPGGERVGESVPPTPLFAAFARRGFEPGAFGECARRCLAQASERPAVVAAPEYGLGVVGTSLMLAGEIVGAAVAGYALVDFPSAVGIERLARAAGLPFRELWEIARQQPPVPQRRLTLHGELLQVLGDTLLRENHRTRQYEETAARLRVEAAAKDEFLAILSHELRTPLSPILHWASILAKHYDEPELCRKAAGAIERGARLQIRLVDDLLDLNRVAHGTLALVFTAHDLGPLLRSAVESTVAAATAKGVALDVVEADEPLTVEGDAGRLQQVFLNVLSNAIKFTPAGGSIRVIAGREAGAATVRIVDTGEGITPGFLPHVFEMFRQQESGTRRRHGGLGVGLALVKRLVELHRGTVEVRSEGAAQGTAVTVRLPLVEPGGPAAGATGPDGGLAAGGEDLRPLAGLTILVVEDAADTLEVTCLLLETFGARVLGAGDGQRALDVLEGSRPDLILCDLRMPRMDGFEFLRELDRRQGATHPPVVAVSGLGSEADRRRTGAAGFAGHLIKPADHQALVSAVRAASRH